MELTNEQQVFQQVINEAWENETFKAELIKEPLKAIEKLTGQHVQLKEGQTLVVRDQTNEETIYINIPGVKNLKDMELNEEQLEHVAGGGDILDLGGLWELPPCFPVDTALDGFKKK